MQDEEPVPNAYDAAQPLRDAEVGFDLIAYLRDHPIAAGVIILTVLIAFFWVMQRRRRNRR